MSQFCYETEIELTVKVRVRVTGDESKGCTTGPADFWEQPYYCDEREILGIEIDGQKVHDDEDVCTNTLNAIRKAVDEAEVCEQ